MKGYLRFIQGLSKVITKTMDIQNTTIEIYNTTQG